MPKIESRPEQAYVARRATMPMRDFQRRVPALTAEVSGWLDAHGVAAAGRPFLRFHVVDMPERLDVALGIPVERAPEAADGIERGALPAGRYAVSTYIGVENGIAANKALIAWIAGQGEAMAYRESEQGDVFASRYETVLTDAEVEPDPGKWETEIAIALRD